MLSTRIAERTLLQRGMHFVDDVHRREEDDVKVAHDRFVQVLKVLGHADDGHELAVQRNDVDVLDRLQMWKDQ